MPTENERKYLLNLYSQQEFVKSANDSYLIKQGYLFSKKGCTLRLRELIDLKDDKTKKRQLTYKQKVNGRIVEIEKKIDHRDFEDLWQLANSKLEKIRYHFLFKKGKEKYLWEVDFFLDGDGYTYFALAEHEMPEGQLEPEFIPPIISKNLLYAVSNHDMRFSSKKLACITYAKNLYKSFSENHYDQNIT